MKKMTKIALIFCAMLLSLGVLFGCQQEKAPAFEGVWVIEAIESEDDTVALTADEVDLFNYAVGPIASLDLNASGNATFKVFGSDMTGTWTKTDDTHAELVITDLGAAANAEIEAGAKYADEAAVESLAMVIEGQSLVVEFNGGRFVFITEAAEAAAQEAVAAEGAADAKAAEEKAAADEKAGLEAEAASKEASK